MEQEKISSLAKMIDHTKLNPDASLSDINKLCLEAKKYGFFSVCVNPFYLTTAKQLLNQTEIKVCTVIGFPLGQNTTATKIFETINAIEAQADEIDMVINIAKLKANDKDFCIDEINQIKKICGSKILKVIVETCLLSESQKELAAQIVLTSDADFIKTSTGFSTAGATFDDIKIFKKIVGDKKLIKAAGGIQTAIDFLKMVEFGANRIGTSKGVTLINQLINL